MSRYFVLTAAVLALALRAGPLAAEPEPAGVTPAVSTAAPAALPAGAAPAAAAPASTEAASAPAAPAAAILGHPERYHEDLYQAVYHLTALRERWEALNPEGLEETLRDLARLDERLKTALGPEAVRELDERDRPRREAAAAAMANSLVARLRQAVQRFHFDSDGTRFPKSLQELVPDYIDAVPELNLPWHGRTDAVTLVNTSKFDKDFSKAVTDTGGWLYFSDPKSDNRGMLIIDCSHKGPDGVELYKR